MQLITNYTMRFSTKTLLVLTFGFISTVVALAQTVPSLMNYQGRLTDESGAPLSNGTYRLAFRLYTNTIPVVGEPLIWGREYDASLIGGVFNVVLGAGGGWTVTEPTAVNDLAFAFTEPSRFLELKVVSDAANATVNRIIRPRQQLLSSPYTFMSWTSARLVQEFQEALNPPGTIVAFGGTNIPGGWLLCDGSPRFVTNYPKLFAAIQTAWGTGYTNGVKIADFNVPDLRGVFLRGVSGSSTNDPDKNGRLASGIGGNSQNDVGSFQDHKLQVHSHQWGDVVSSATTIYRLVRSYTSSAPSAGLVTILSNGAYGDADGSSGSRDDYLTPINGATLYTSPTSTIGQSGETRPRNAYVHYIIKY